MNDKRRPAEQAKGGRCNARDAVRLLSGDRLTVVCARWAGHGGPHRGCAAGQFYGYQRYEWRGTNDPARVVGGHGGAAPVR